MESLSFVFARRDGRLIPSHLEAVIEGKVIKVGRVEERADGTIALVVTEAEVMAVDG